MSFGSVNTTLFEHWYISISINKEYIKIKSVHNHNFRHLSFFLVNYDTELQYSLPTQCHSKRQALNSNYNLTLYFTNLKAYAVNLSIFPYFMFARLL